MAGIQICYRKLLVVGTSRVVCKNVILRQPNRGRHSLVFQISLQQSKSVLSRTRFNLAQQSLYRLASTNVTEGKEILKDTEIVAPAKDTTTPISQSAPVETPSSNVGIDESLLPPVPSTEEVAPVLEFITTGLGEPTLKSIGLGSWYPSGIVQQVLEFFHVTFDMPWWAAIATLTVFLRVVTFPVTLSCRRDTINMMNNMPTISQFQIKINEAKKNGDYFTAASYMQELQVFVKEKKINMFAFVKPAFYQAPFFISMFWGLRGMADAPVESLKTQGLFWFTDLTAADPYYLLPIILGSSMYAVIWVGAEGVSLQNVNNHVMQLVLRGMPLVVFAFATQFSSCVVWYWAISNLTVLTQTALLKIPYTAKFFNLPKMIKHDATAFAPKKGFIEGFKEGLTNAKITKEVEERERLNSLKFEKAGSGSIPRTFKHNPKLANAPKPVANKLS